MKRMLLGVLFVALGMMLTGCSDSSLSNAKSVTAFSFENPAAQGTISETSHTIAVTMPFGTDVTKLAPTVIHTGAGISPATGVAQDFADAVIYTVTAADNSTQDYTVTVTVASSTAKAITAFSFANYNAVGTISETSHTIAVTVPFGTEVTALVPTIIHTGTIIAPASGVAQDFTNPVVYTVTAADASTQDYTVTVTVTPSSSKEITAFNFAAPAAEGTISEASHTIDATLPSGTVVTALVPTIVHTGTSISPASEVAQDFTNPVVYTVTAADASTQDYTVTVTVAPWEVCGDVLTYAGENYPTVQIGTQCWIARNLDVGTATPSANGQGTSCASIKKFCYEDSASNCETYGGMYTWTQAMCGAQTEKSQGICSPGWHIPSDPEYVTLANALGPGGCYPYPGGNYPGTFCGAPAGDRLKSAGLCQGRTPCGDSGFEGLLGGGFSPSGDNVVFYSVEVQASFWTSSLNGNNVEAWRRGLDVNYSGVDGSYFWTSITTGRSVRCVKDE
jgi:uncharacterized protein (TIGR02145 family)